MALMLVSFVVSVGLVKVPLEDRYVNRGIVGFIRDHQRSNIKQPTK